MSDKTAEELATEAREPGKFSFIERLRGRAYATDDVTIYLNEQLGYDLQALKLTYENAENLTADQLTKLEEEIERVRNELKPDAIIFHLHGISNKQYDEIINDAKAQFPYEFEERVDPWTGKKEKDVVQTRERTEYFLTRLWLACISSVEDAEGNVDELNVEAVEAIRELAPPAATEQVQGTIDKLRMATDWIEGVEDEDFLAKP